MMIVMINRNIFAVQLLFVAILVSLIAFPNNVKAENQQVQEKLVEDDIIHIPTNLKIPNEDLINLLSYSKIVYVGETHDNYRVHQMQLKIIKDLYNKLSGNIAIGMEMFQKRSQDELDLWIAGKLSEKEFLKNVWYPDWGYEYEYYREIIEFAKNNKVKIIALNANESTVKMINEKGIDKLSKKEMENLPEIDTTDMYHRMHVKAVFDVHQKNSMGDFDSFYRVQCLWEETMAQSVVDYLSKEPGNSKQVIVLAGKDHVRYGFGIPKRVFRRMRNPYSIVLPIELNIPDNKAHNVMNIEDVRIPLHESDYLWMVNYTDPEINKVRIGVMVINSSKGVIAHMVEEGSPAERIGIIKDDIILDVDGVAIKDSFDLVYEIRSKTPGNSGKIKVLRNGQEIVLNIIYELAKPEEKK